MERGNVSCCCYKKLSWHFAIDLESLGCSVDKSQEVLSVDIYWPVRRDSKPVCRIWAVRRIVYFDRGGTACCKRQNTDVKALRAKCRCMLDVSWAGVPGNCPEGSATFDPVFKFLLVWLWIFNHDNNQVQDERKTAVCRRTSGVSV